MPPSIREQAAMTLSSEEYIAIYNNFCDGRDTIELQGELIVDEDEFDKLVGPGPYPTYITSNPNFADMPKLHSALHGVMVHRYLAYCEDMITRCHKFPEWHMYSGLYSTYNELAMEYNKTTKTARRYFEEGKHGATSIAVLNGRWISRMIVYTVDDMVSVKEGRERLLGRVCERRWRLRHSLAM